MHVLIGNIVKTDRGDYVCGSREEAEALLLTLRELDEKRAQRRAQNNSAQPARRQTRRRS